VEPITAPGAGQPDAALTLRIGKFLLGGDGRTVEDRVGVVEFGDYAGRIGLTHRIEGNDDRRRERQWLQAVDQVGNRNRLCARRTAAGSVVPRRPEFLVTGA